MVGALGRILCATVAAANLDETAAFYEQHLGYLRAVDAVLDPGLAHAWQAPQAAGSRFVELVPPSRDGPTLRIVARPRLPGYTALTTVGWNALEFLVEDPDGLATRLQVAAVPMLGPPADLAAFPAIRATQFRDPADVCIYFTRIGDEMAARGMPQARIPVDRMFVIVLGSADLEDSISYYRQTHGMKIARPERTRITVLSTAHGLDRETRHLFTTMPLEPGYLIEMDGYPVTATARPVAPSDLAAGIAILTFAGVPGGPRPTYSSWLGGEPRTASLFFGPDGEGIEIMSP